MDIPKFADFDGKLITLSATGRQWVHNSALAQLVGMMLLHPLNSHENNTCLTFP